MISFPSRHLGKRQVIEFAEGESPADERARIEAHLADCPRCRASMSATRELLASVEDWPAPEPRTDALARILARRTEGARVILPTEPDALRAERAFTSRRVWWVAAAAAAVVAVGLLVISGSTPRDLAAGDLDGKLDINPAVSARGDSVRFTYRAGSMLAGERVLRVRARYYAAGDREPQWSSTYVTAATLSRGGDGAFRGSLVLPDSIIYALVVVEDTLGRTVDSHGGQLWEILTRGTAAGPSFASLRQRVWARESRDPGSTLAAARMLTQRFPSEPEAWALRVWYELDAVGPALEDSVRRAFRPQLATLDAPWRKQASVGDDELSHLEDVARQLAADSVRVYWDSRLKEAARAHRGPAREWQRLSDIGEVKDVRGALAALDSFWRDTSNSGKGRNSALVRAVMRLETSKDRAALSMWGERVIRYGEPNFRAWPGYKFAHTPGLEARGAELTRAMLDIYTTNNDAHRPIGTSVDEQRNVIRRHRGGMLRTLGEALVATGALREATDTLERSVRDVWSASAYRTLADVRFRLGDTAGAAVSFAHVAADPGSSPDTVQALRRHFTSRPDILAQWNQLVTAAQTDLHRDVLADAIHRPLRGTVRLVGMDGRERTFADITRGNPAAVAFWSRWCSGSREFLPGLTTSTARLRADGIPLIAITAEQVSPDLMKWMSDNHVQLDVYYDARGEARNAFAARGTPDQFVVDERGVIRFVGGTPDDLAPRVEAIRAKR